MSETNTSQNQTTSVPANTTADTTNTKVKLQETKDKLFQTKDKLVKSLKEKVINPFNKLLANKKTPPKEEKKPVWPKEIVTLAHGLEQEEILNFIRNRSDEAVSKGVVEKELERENKGFAADEWEYDKPMWVVSDQGDFYCEIIKGELGRIRIIGISRIKKESLQILTEGPLPSVKIGQTLNVQGYEMGNIQRINSCWLGIQILNTLNKYLKSINGKTATAEDLKELQKTVIAINNRLPVTEENKEKTREEIPVNLVPGPNFTDEASNIWKVILQGPTPFLPLHISSEKYRLQSCKLQMAEIEQPKRLLPAA